MEKADQWNANVLEYCQGLPERFVKIESGRISKLDEIADYIRQHTEPSLIVICTHNSRRSHFGQIWLQVAAHYYSINLKVYSGGTEATAFHPNAVAAMRRAGFVITKDDARTNPHYRLSFGEGLNISCFSKRFDHPENPQSGFGAIMVCSDAAEACPFVPGANKRFVLPYNDPKESDDMPWQDDTYSERCRQIATEMFYIMHTALQDPG